MSSDRRIADLCASFRSVAAQSTGYSVLLQPIGEQSSNRRSQAFEFFEFQTAVHLFRQHGFQLGPTKLRSDLLNPLVNLVCIQFAPHNEIIQVRLQRFVKHCSLVNSRISNASRVFTILRETKVSAFATVDISWKRLG